MEETKQKRKAYPKGEDRAGSTQKMVSFRIDKKLLAWLNSKPNKGRYLNDLIAADIRKSWVNDEHASDLEELGDFEE